MGRVYNDYELSAMLRCHVGKIYEMLNRAEIKGRKIGNRWLVPGGSLQEFLTNKRR